jgi:glycosyltransferase involved in cell wall biosynthesis
MRTWRPSEEFDMLLTRPDAWIAASGAVQDLLIDEYGLPADRVRLHHEFINAHEIADRRVPLREVEQLRRELRIPADAAIVMGAGTVDWRKGPDLFVQLAAEVRRRVREPIHFIWVGGDLTGTDWQRVWSDIERTGSDHVHFVGVKPDPVPWFAMADVFALTSHEDPFPLVCLEHAAMGHPIVTYRNGGMPELLDSAGPEAAAGIADHLDVGGLAERVLAFLDNDQLRQKAGEQLRRQVLERHDLSVAAERLYQDLVRLSETPSQRPSD